MGRFNKELGPLGLYVNKPLTNFRILVRPEAPLIYSHKLSISLNYPAPETLKRIDKAAKMFTDNPDTLVAIWKSYSSLFNQLHQQRLVGKFKSGDERWRTTSIIHFAPIPKSVLEYPEVQSDFRKKEIENTERVIQRMLECDSKYGGFNFKLGEGSGLNIGTQYIEKQESWYQSKEEHQRQVNTWYEDGLNTYPHGMATVTPVGWHDRRPTKSTRSIFGGFEAPTQ